MTEDWINFEGNDDCDETCRGWDGEGRRCECGNRRVGWECILDECNKEKGTEDCANCSYGYATAW